MASDERQARLLMHVRRGWQRVAANEAERRRALEWLGAHPSSWREVDQLWREALAGGGASAQWLDADADPSTWSHAIPLHSFLASHPFACLSPWSNPTRSNRS